MSVPEDVSGRAREAASDYSLFPGFVLFSQELAPWMGKSGLFDFSLSIKKITHKSESQEHLSGEISPFSDIQKDEVGSYLRGFPFQFRELVAR